jgi:hypothetical protein
MIDTLKISNSLQEHQFSREQVEAIAAAIAEVAGAELVTRKDLDLARGALKLAISTAPHSPTARNTADATGSASRSWKPGIALGWKCWQTPAPTY